VGVILLESKKGRLKGHRLRVLKVWGGGLEFSEKKSFGGNGELELHLAKILEKGKGARWHYA